MILLVSIRASLQQRGELIGSPKKQTNISFQSAPHFSSEANHPRWMGLPAILQFQSAPHFSSEANDRSGTAEGADAAFQSAPHFSSEANTREKIVLSRQLCFNPRLTSAARRTHLSVKSQKN